MGEWVRFAIVVLAMLGACCVAYRFDRDILEPALTRRSARALGISEAEYRAARKDFLAAPWRRLCKLVWSVTAASRPYSERLIRPGLRGYVHFIRHSGMPLRKTVRPSARLRQALAEADFWQWAAETPVVPR